jgi:O-antigen/teichoic acid export membrane protein
VSLLQKIIRGAQWTAVGTVGTTALQLVKLAILARSLAPEELGLMAIVMIVVGFSQAFADMGVSNAIIHHQDITHVQLSSLYWLNLASGVCLTCIVFGFAPLIAIFFKQPDLQALTMTMSSLFILTAIGQQYRILCQKEMQLGIIAFVTLSAELVATVVAIYLARLGYGVWALVYSTILASALTSFVFLFIGIRRHHKPTWIYRHRELKGFYSFGIYQMGERSINYISANIDKILIGKILGTSAVGFYNMAWQLIIFPLSRINPIVNTVAFPAYAKLQLETDRRERYYTASMKLLSLITIPLLVFLFFFAGEIVILVYGKGWEQTSILVQILAIVGIAYAFGNPGGALILALGRADIGFWWNVFMGLMISICMFLALRYKPNVESAAYTLLTLSLSSGFIWHYLIAQIGKLNYRPIVRHFIKVLFVSILLGIGAKYFIFLFEMESNFLIIFAGGSFFSLFYIGYLAIVERAFLNSIFRIR